MENNNSRPDAHPIQSLNTTSYKSDEPKRKGNGCLIAALVFFIFTTFIAGGLFLVSATLLGGSASSATTSSIEEVVKEGGNSKAVLIDIAGVIEHSSTGSIFATTQVANPNIIIPEIDRALEDDDVKVIILDIESPGGTVVASDLIYNKLIEARAKKPVVAYSETMAASGGYYIAAAANEFVTYPSSITGSIGVILQVTNTDKLYEKLGIDVRTFKSARFKDTQELFDTDDSGELDGIFQEQIDEEYEEFVKSIVEGRNMDEAKVRELGDGRIYSGRQALSNGLADYNGDFDVAVGRAESLSGISDLTVVRYSKPAGFWESITSSLNTKFSGLLNVAPKTQIGIQKYYLLDM